MTGLRAFAAMFAVWAMPIAAVAGPTGTTMEAQVLALLNVARAHPQTMIDDLRHYRALFHANLVVLSAEESLETSEGVIPVDEAIGFLSNHAVALPLARSTMLTEAAADHVGEQARTGEIGHGGAHGLNPSDRVMRRGGGPLVAEMIAYGAHDAAEVVRQLIVDDGVRDRGHRTILFAPRLRYVGVVCGPHPVFDTMCVIDLAETSDARGSDLPRLDYAER